MEQPSCAVCWRNYDATTVVPVIFPCGHSFCADCGAVLRVCSLCRHKVPSNHPRKVNFSLLSAIEHYSQQQRPQKTDQQTNTDDLFQPAATKRRQTPQTTFFQGKTMTVNLKKSGLQLSIT